MTFSLHPVKTIAAGEGGIVTTADEALAERMRLFRNHGMSRTDFTATDQAFAADGDANPWYYEMTEPALNYRLSDIHAALAASQLARQAAEGLPAAGCSASRSASRLHGQWSRVAGAVSQEIRQFGPQKRHLLPKPYCREPLRATVRRLASL